MRDLRVGFDVGSTTIKAVVLEESELVFHSYRRHGSDLKVTLLRLFLEVKEFLGSAPFRAAITGSGALGLCRALGLEFIQEVAVTEVAIRRFCPGVDIAIELGGEDAKIIFFGENTGFHMNNTCAGGTGAFIDQMAALFDTDAPGLDQLARSAKTVVQVASRCGVFAKTDVQASINDGKSRADVALGIFDAVARQAIGQLAQGRPLAGNAIFLGGPLTFLKSLRDRFVARLDKVSSVTLPPNSELFAAIGVALCAPPDRSYTIQDLSARLEAATDLDGSLEHLRPLFSSTSELNDFRQRHNIRTPMRTVSPGDPLFLGVDLGSTTIKAILMADDGAIVRSWYTNNGGNARHLLDDLFAEIARDFPGNPIVHSVATGYGENLLLRNYGVTSGVVETIAHLRAAKHLDPAVESIVDIGGQDMKYIKVKNGHVVDIQLNEACSSGCGSFLETLAKPLGYSAAEFAELALKSSDPVDLGTRCTVFMNSCVRQAQSEQIPLPDISAGLAYSVVKNALYKVARLRNPEQLGDHIVVQGGTFLSDAVLRAFELETGKTAIRPDIAGLMGAYGAALIARDRANGAPYQLEVRTDAPNLMATKLDLLFDRKSSDFWSDSGGYRGQIGVPMALYMFDKYPFFHALLSTLGFDVVPSNLSTRDTYQIGIATVSSGTVCYPAKLAHGHVIELANLGIGRIFMPMLKWEIREDGQAKNHYSCPVVMGYPDSLSRNLEVLKSDGVDFFAAPLSIDRPQFLVHQLASHPWFTDIPKRELSSAVSAAFEADKAYREKIEDAGRVALKWIEETNGRGIVLGGHPYHFDPEVNHGIPKMIAGLGVAVLTEDSIAHLAKLDRPLRIVDQWTYHLRTIKAAHFTATHPHLDFVQLISFSCGIDAVTGDQIEEILHHLGCPYTSLKIDEIGNLGAARIRIRSLLSTTDNHS